MYVNLFLNLWSFLVDRIQWNLLGQTEAARGEISPLTPSLSNLRLHLSTKPLAAPWETESFPETLEKFHTLAQLSDREGIIEICHCVFSLISICVWCRSSNYQARGKTWAVSLAGGYYNRLTEFLRWISHIWHVDTYSSSLHVSILQ